MFWAASDVGWVVGHSYIVYGPLIHGCTTVLYEGKPVRTPDAGAFWRVIQDYGVSAFFTAPTAFRAIKKEDPDAHLRRLTTSPPCARSTWPANASTRPTYDWLRQVLDVPIVDHWWQTETGWPIAANPMGLEPTGSRPGSATFPVPGFKVEVLDDAGQPVPAGREGQHLPQAAVAARLPADPVERRRGLSQQLPEGLRRLLPHRRRRLRR